MSRKNWRIKASKGKPNSTKLGGPQGEFRAAGCVATIQAADDGDPKKLPTFTGRAYTGAPMRPGGWWDDVIIDLEGVRVPSQHRPVLRQHDHTKIVGHTESVKVSKDGIDIAGPFSGVGPDRDEVVKLAGNGFKWQLSVGANPIRREFLEHGETTTVNGREVTGPLVISRETELGEISFVPLGADGDTSAVVSASKGGPFMFAKAALKLARSQGVAAAVTFTDEEIDKMNEDTAKATLKKCMKADGEEDEDDDDKPKAKAKAAKAADDDEDKKTEAARAARLQASRKADADEMRRVSGIKAACAKYPGVNKVKLEDGREVDLIPHAIEAGWSANDAELHAVRAARPGPGVGVPGGLAYSISSPEVGEPVLECAMFQAMGSQFHLFDDDFYNKGTKDRDPIPKVMASRVRADLRRRYPEKVQDDAHRLFHSRIGIHQLLTSIARENGYRGRETISDDNLGEVSARCMHGIRADGASTISVANVTANVLNKFLLQGYFFTELAWRQICAIRATKDFKATKSINLFGDTEFKDLGTNSELEHGTLQDQAFANQVKTSGRILTIPRSTIINDDLGAFGQVPMVMGRGAGLKLNKVFWMKFMSPGYDDGGTTNFFAATHTLLNGQVGNSNLSSGAGSALSSAGLNAATVLFDNQVDPMGNPLGIDAEILLYPADLDTTARELMNSEWIVQSAGATTKQPSNNVWKGRYNPVKSRYLNKTLTDKINGTLTTVSGSTANWWLLANPAIIAAIEVAFLNGQEMPTVQAAGPDFQFNVMGMTTRAFFDMGVNMQNFRAGVKSAGS